MTGWRRLRVLAVLATGAALVLSCGPSDRSSATADEPGGGVAELVVSAASSLTDAFGTLADRFEREHPGVTVVLNVDSSSTLATQIVNGAPVDVFASADAANMAEVRGTGVVVGEPRVLATNDLVIVAPSGNPESLGALSDLEASTRRGEVVALCAAEAPCGRLADRALADAGVSLPEGQVTRAANARSTLGAVTRGDAAAALVYTTDALAAGDAVRIVPIDGTPVSTRYEVAAVDTGDGDPELAAAFVELVTSAGGRAVLASEGFR